MIIRHVARPACALLALGLVLGPAGCATIVQGPRQKVSFTSTPTGARVWVNDRELGRTPVVADLQRKESHFVRISLYPYADEELRLERRINGWFWGNIALGAVVGLAVDAMTGAMYRLTPDQLHTTLGSGVALLEGTDDVLILSFVLEPGPDWETIGSLDRASR